MKDICADLLAEYGELAALAENLTAPQWLLRSEFYGWTAWDEVAHLCYFDETALQSVTHPQAFARDAALLGQRMARGEAISVVAREHFGSLAGPELLARWRLAYGRLVSALSRLDPKARLAWYGPTMSARSFTTARLMETWAHGQDVWDVVRLRRPQTARLKHIAHLGVTTFGWTFVNRHLAPPSSAPYVELSAPAGDTWTWNEASAEHFVRGSAEDFCLLVTQRRHLDDTALQVGGDNIRQWLSMAQCFAGPPANGPAPGVRRVVY